MKFEDQMRNLMLTTEELEKASLQKLSQIEAIKDPNVIADLWNETLGKLEAIEKKLDFLVKVASGRP